MKKFIAGLVVGLIAVVGGTATAATVADYEWRHMENDGVMCSVGRYGTNLNESAVCVLVGGKWHTWSVSLDKELGIKIENGNDRVMFKRGNWGGH